MIPLLAPAAVRAIDRHAVSVLGLPSIALMENAGAGATAALVLRFPEHLGRVVLFGGPGQNGGDAWVVARHLTNRGAMVRAILVGSRDRVRGDAATNLAVLEAMGSPVVPLADVDLDDALRDATLVVDGLFGTGLDREMTGDFAAVAEAIARCSAKVVALDVPSGIDGATGAVLGSAVRADLTTTFAADKRGLHQHPGRAYAGEIVWVGIGVPPPTLTDAAVHLLEQSDVRRLVPPRSARAHKGTAGRVFVFAGGPGKSGAAVLAGRGALRAGAGLVTLAPRAEAFAAVSGEMPELMSALLPVDADAALAEALRLAKGIDAAVVGPGLGLDPTGRLIALGLARDLPMPAVLDADALTALADDATSGPLFAKGPRVLTPHPGEAGRLLGCSAAEVEADRYESAKRLVDRTGVTVVLKGAGTIIASPDGTMRVCPFGTAALATGGTGDVLAGVVAGFLAAGLSPFDAASVAVVLHALAGELAATADRGLVASEVADAIPRALASC